MLELIENALALEWDGPTFELELHHFLAFQTKVNDLNFQASGSLGIRMFVPYGYYEDQTTPVGLKCKYRVPKHIEGGE